MYYNQINQIKMFGGQRGGRKRTCRRKAHRGGRKTRRVRRGGQAWWQFGATVEEALA